MNIHVEIARLAVKWIPRNKIRLETGNGNRKGQKRKLQNDYTNHRKLKLH